MPSKNNNVNTKKNLPPNQRASPAIASTAIKTSIAEIISIALPIFQVELPFCFFVGCGATLDHVDRGGKTICKYIRDKIIARDNDLRSSRSDNPVEVDVLGNKKHRSNIFVFIVLRARVTRHVLFAMIAVFNLVFARDIIPKVDLSAMRIVVQRNRLCVSRRRTSCTWSTRCGESEKMPLEPPLESPLSSTFDIDAPLTRSEEKNERKEGSGKGRCERTKEDRLRRVTEHIQLCGSQSVVTARRFSKRPLASALRKCFMTRIMINIYSTNTNPLNIEDSESTVTKYFAWPIVVRNRITADVRFSWTKEEVKKKKNEKARIRSLFARLSTQMIYASAGAWSMTWAESFRGLRRDGKKENEDEEDKEEKKKKKKMRPRRTARECKDLSRTPPYLFAVLVSLNEKPYERRVYKGRKNKRKEDKIRHKILSMALRKLLWIFSSEMPFALLPSLVSLTWTSKIIQKEKEKGKEISSLLLSTPGHFSAKVVVMKASYLRKDRTLSVDDDSMLESLLVLIINYLDNYLDSFTEFTEPNCKAIVMIAIEWTGLRTGGPTSSFTFVVVESYESFINDRKEPCAHREERERSVSFAVTNAIAR
ncbi:LOW QUALITY PROTEIN: hypothetical protein V1478_014674 [Vespula squamosa]|uniref:Uncharacterized protein n=1 Tax=Vespula squamosa TaxID=30214 RepID=A0ABD2A2W7_VESSQ